MLEIFDDYSQEICVLVLIFQHEILLVLMAITIPIQHAKQHYLFPVLAFGEVSFLRQFNNDSLLSADGQLTRFSEFDGFSFL